MNNPPDTMNDLRVEIADRQAEVECDHEMLRRLLQETVSDAGFESGEVSLALVSDSVIRNVNSRFLEQDELTDVIAFTYEKDDKERRLEGEIVLNASQAARVSRNLRHDAFVELMLYAVHGALHLLGWDDSTPAARNALNHKAVLILRSYGIQVDDSTLADNG